jgi:predicted PurR-regulated permease PerM
VSRSAILGTLGTAAAQGTAAAIGMTLVGLPGLFWGAILAFTSLIPFVGTALVWVPTVGFLLATGHPGKAAFFAAWSILIVGSIDNFLRPILMKGEGGISTLWMFFAVLGGLNLFGLPGLIYGPLIFGLCAVLLLLYRDEFADALAKQAGP